MARWRRQRKRNFSNSPVDSPTEEQFLKLWNQSYPHTPVTLQHRFNAERRWKFDFCWPIAKVAVEIQGHKAYHTSYDGMFKDYEKWNTATLSGWSIILLMSKHLNKDNKNQTLLDIYAHVKKRSGIRSK